MVEGQTKLLKYVQHLFYCVPTMFGSRFGALGFSHAPARIPTTQATPCEVGLDFEYGIPVLCTGLPLFGR